ncbi:MAG: energy transducer TonB [Parvibaculum sp.]|uniref:TonB family protein n=1 Tax=Parvibaculum sp. TaxID=2024848 RepID=UPI003C7735C9
MSVAFASEFPDTDGAGASRRWGTSFVAVAAFHIGLGAAMVMWHPVAEMPEAPQPALFIDMMPVPAAVPEQLATKVEEPPRVQEPPKIEKAEVALHRKKLKPEKPKPVSEPRKTEQPAAQQQPDRPVAAASRPAGPSAAQIAAKQNYISHLFGHLERYKRYPAAARRRHQEGTVHLRFAMNARGYVTSARIEKGSGFSALDREVIEMIRRAEPLPPPPPEMPSEYVLPLTFVLK